MTIVIIQKCKKKKNAGGADISIIENSILSEAWLGFSRS